MKVFLLKQKNGTALVVAKNQEEALEVLKKYEVDEYLTFRTSAADFKEIEMNNNGVVFYVAD